MRINKKVNRMVKVVASIAVAATMMLSTGVFASAASISKTGTSFKNSWERYASTSDNKGCLTYGFNTFLIDEDYAHAKHSTKSHYAAINNGKGWHTGPGKVAGKTSKIEVTHKGTTVKYYLYY